MNIIRIMSLRQNQVRTNTKCFTFSTILAGSTLAMTRIISSFSRNLTVPWKGVTMKARMTKLQERASNRRMVKVLRGNFLIIANSGKWMKIIMKTTRLAPISKVSRKTEDGKSKICVAKNNEITLRWRIPGSVRQHNLCNTNLMPNTSAMTTLRRMGKHRRLWI